MEHIWSQFCSEYHLSNQFGGKSSMPFAGRTTDGRPLAWLQRIYNNNSSTTTTSIQLSSSSASSTKGGNDIKDIGLQATSTISAQAITLSSPFQLFDTIPVPLSSTSSMISRRHPAIGASSHSTPTSGAVHGITGSSSESNDENGMIGACRVPCMSYNYYRQCHEYGESSDRHQLFLQKPTKLTQYDGLHKCLWTGASGVGKSAMITRFFDDYFVRAPGDPLPNTYAPSSNHVLTLLWGDISIVTTVSYGFRIRVVNHEGKIIKIQARHAFFLIALYGLGEVGAPEREKCEHHERRWSYRCLGYAHHATFLCPFFCCLNSLLIQLEGFHSNQTITVLHRAFSSALILVYIHHTSLPLHRIFFFILFALIVRFESII
jgi:hypothetical protein